MSNNGFKEGCSVFIQREVRALEDKKSSIYQKIQNAQIVNHKVQCLKEQALSKQNRIKIIKTELSKSQTRIYKLKRKYQELQNSKISKIVELQHLQIQRQQIKQQIVSVFSPKISDLNYLRFKLICIETNQQLIDISHIFSIRNTIIGFLVNNNIDLSCIKKGAQIYICKNNLVDSFKNYALHSLKQNKLEQFSKVFCEPIDQYIKILFQIQQLFNKKKVEHNHHQQTIQNFEQTQSSLIVKIKQVKLKMVYNQRELVKINTKIEQSSYKLKKYEQYCQELILQKQGLQLQLQTIINRLKTQELQSSLLQQYTLQLQQVKQAIFYLKEKKIEQQNKTTLNSIKSMGLLQTIDESISANRYTMDQNIKRYTIEQNCQRNSYLSNSKSSLKINVLRSPQRLKQTIKSNKMCSSQRKWK